MKIKEGLILKEIAGNYIIVPLSGSLVDLNAMINVNETGAFLFKELESETTKEKLVDMMTKEYEIDKETAGSDIEDFLDVLRKNSMLDE